MTMTSDDIRLKVRCGACHGPLRSGPLCFVELRRKATWKYPTSGNVLTGEEGLATAIVCEACIDAKKEIVEAVEFAHASDEPVYHPIVELEAAPFVVVDTFEPNDFWEDYPEND